MNLTGENIRRFAHLPVNDPVLVFAIILLIIFLSPLLLRKFKIPGIIFLIISGIIIGPNGLHLIEKNAAIDLFSTIGILFLMFIAGLNLDRQQFRNTRHKSLLFGILTYLLPLIIGFPVCYYLLGYNFITSLMISNMLATHTMVSYPVVTRLGLTRNEAVAVATGGTIIADSIVLLVLAALAGSTTGDAGIFMYGKIILFFLVFILILIYLVPPLSRWVFKRIEDDNYSQFIYVTLVVFICAVVARIAGLEPIIGAFAAGFIMSGIIPRDTILRNRIDFAGNALFIPFFLISIGMIVSLKSIISGPSVLIIAAILTTVAFIGKWAAAGITSLILRFSQDQRNLLFGLSLSRAAAILAVIMVGYRIGLVDNNVIDATIVLILVTCLVSSFITETAGKRLVISSNKDAKHADHFMPESILVSLSNPQSMERLLDLALTMKRKNHNNPLYGLCVVDDNDAATIKLSQARSSLERAGIRAQSSGRKIETLATIDNNIATGIKRVAREKSVTDIIVGTPGKANISDFLFGRSLEQLIQNPTYNTFVYNPVNPLNLYSKVILMLPPHAEKEPGFIFIIDKVIRLAENNSIVLESYSYGHTFSVIEDHLKKIRSDIVHNFYSITEEKEQAEINIKITGNDLLVILSPQSGNISYDQGNDSFIKRIIKNSGENGQLIIYPGLINA